jgi:hypothetical protein
MRRLTVVSLVAGCLALTACGGGGSTASAASLEAGQAASSYQHAQAAVVRFVANADVNNSNGQQSGRKPSSCDALCRRLQSDTHSVLPSAHR